MEDEELGAHRIILAARSPVFAALLNSGMREAGEGVVSIQDCRAPVFRALLHFVYTDALPEVRVPAAGTTPRRLSCTCYDALRAMRCARCAWEGALFCWEAHHIC